MATKYNNVSVYDQHRSNHVCGLPCSEAEEEEEEEEQLEMSPMCMLTDDMLM